MTICVPGSKHPTCSIYGKDSLYFSTAQLFLELVLQNDDNKVSDRKTCRVFQQLISPIFNELQKRKILTFGPYFWVAFFGVDEFELS